jgi:hypothetical protein
MPPNNQGQPYFQGSPQQLPPQPTAASQLKPSRPWALITALIVSVLLIIGLATFAFWAYGERQDYKDRSDQKSAQAVKKAEEELTKKKEAEFTEREKQPFKSYTSPSTAGTIAITYPKTWSAFVTENDKAPTPVDGYFHPGFVPGIQSGTSFALRMEVVNQSYDQVMRQFESNIKSGKAKLSPFRAAKVQAVLGSRIDGQIATNKQGSIVVLPLRDKTIKISTEGSNFIADFNNTILANLTFVP